MSSNDLRLHIRTDCGQKGRGGVKMPELICGIND